MEKIKLLMDRQPHPNPAAHLAIKLGITEQYVRMLASGKATPGWRLERDIDALMQSYKETKE